MLNLNFWLPKAPWSWNFFKILPLLLMAGILTGSASDLHAQQRHTVQRGETLYSISRTLNVSVAELREWNQLSGNELNVGQELLYYTNEQETAPADTVRGPSLISRPQIQTNAYYVVKSGDNLTRIAGDHDMSVAELKALNGMTSDLIRVGQRLTVRKLVDSVAPSAQEYSGESSPQGAFVIYTVKAGESSADILERFEMSRTELRDLNPSLQLDALREGQRITVLLPSTGTFNNPYAPEAGLEDLGSVTATKYQEERAGTATSSGELYDPQSLSAAHANIALGTILFVRNPETGTGIYVRINDRIPENGIKLSQRAWEALGLSGSAEASLTMYLES